jgi:ketosteroid isomerase-like protein
VARLDKAMAKRDPKAVTALLAKDAVIEVHGTGAGKPAAMDRAGFAAYLGTAFAKANYVYEVQSARISLSKDKPRATVTRTVREAVASGDRTVVTELRERLNVEHDGRRALIRKLHKAPPNEKRAGPTVPSPG